MSEHQSRIAIAVPYFGKLPNYFQLWLISCKYNPSIDWYVFTNDQTEFQYPDNVHVTYESFEDMRKRFQSSFDFKIAINVPYKLCDFRPSYGEVFVQIFKNYDFWGFCDLDIIFGNIRNFLTEEILDKHDKILTLGHFTLYRNSGKINQMYREHIGAELAFRKVFSAAKYLGFDERGPFTIEAIFKNKEVRVYNEIVFADVKIEKYNFELTHSKLDKIERQRKCTVFAFQQGRLVRYFLEDNRIGEREYLYVHLQKRPMKLELSITKQDKFLIIPNKFIDYNDIINIKTIRLLGKHKGIMLRNVWIVFKENGKSILRGWIKFLFHV